MSINHKLKARICISCLLAVDPALTVGVCEEGWLLILTKHGCGVPDVLSSLSLGAASLQPSQWADPRESPSPLKPPALTPAIQHCSLHLVLLKSKTISSFHKLSQITPWPCKVWQISTAACRRRYLFCTWAPLCFPGPFLVNWVQIISRASSLCQMWF